MSSRIKNEMDAIFPPLVLSTFRSLPFAINAPETVHCRGIPFTITRTARTCVLLNYTYSIALLNRKMSRALGEPRPLFANVIMLIDADLRTTPQHIVSGGIRADVDPARLGAFAAAVRDGPRPFDVAAYFGDTVGTPALATHHHMRQYLRAALNLLRNPSRSRPVSPNKQIEKSRPTAKLTAGRLATGPSYGLFPTFSLLHTMEDATFAVGAQVAYAANAVALFCGTIAHQGGRRLVFVLRPTAAAAFTDLPVLFDAQTRRIVGGANCINEAALHVAFRDAFRASSAAGRSLNVFEFCGEHCTTKLPPPHTVFRRWIDDLLAERELPADTSRNEARIEDIVPVLDDPAEDAPPFEFEPPADLTPAEPPPTSAVVAVHPAETMPPVLSTTIASSVRAVTPVAPRPVPTSTAERLHVYRRESVFGKSMMRDAHEAMCAANAHATPYGVRCAGVVSSIDGVVAHMQASDVRARVLPYLSFVQMTAEQGATLQPAYSALSEARRALDALAAATVRYADHYAASPTTYSAAYIDHLQQCVAAHEALSSAREAFEALDRRVTVYFAVWRAPERASDAGRAGTIIVDF